MPTNKPFHQASLQDMESVYQLAEEFSLETNRCIFITGKAGTGKTTFLRTLREKTHKQIVVAAPTGVAAINAGGITLHSLFQLPFAPFLPTDEGRKALLSGMKMRDERRKVLYEMELLVIDEVSMVRADTLDAIDTILRTFRNNHEPFGGVQVILIGDLFQLSPVAQPAEWQILSSYYTGCYFFQSHVMSQLKPVYVELDTIFRQQNTDFVSLLNEIRNNTLSPAGKAQLLSLYKPNFQNDDAQNFYITLTTHNAKADRINAEALDKLEGEALSYSAHIEGDFPDKSYPTDALLELKLNARVMFVKNDEAQPRRFYNGKIGCITQLDDDEITVLCEGENEPINVPRMAWNNVRYQANEQTKQLEEEVLGTFVQFPLRLAWAITIHKSQGLTFDRAVIDIGDAFAPGQVYVALSRCRSLEGVVMLSRLREDSLRNASDILQYDEQKNTVPELQQMLEPAKAAFCAQTFGALFDFRTMQGFADRLDRYVAANKEDFNYEAVMEFLNGIKTQLNALETVGSKFRQWLLQTMSAPHSKDLVHTRMTAAMAYFAPLQEQLLCTLTTSPATVEVKKIAAEYDDMLKTLANAVAQKSQLMEAMKPMPSVETYYAAKHNFVAPPFSITSYAGRRKAMPSGDVRFPKLYQQLVELRNDLVATDKLPVYVVGGNAMLQTMANRLPLTAAELLRLKGFGTNKMKRYGEQFLEVLRTYCQENDLYEYAEQQREAEEAQLSANDKGKIKRKKGDSQRDTLQLFRQGKSIEQIAAERSLTIGTIVTHLCSFLSTGETKLSELLPDDKRDKAIDLIKDTIEEEVLDTRLRDLLSPAEYAVFAWVLRSNREAIS